MSRPDGPILVIGIGNILLRDEGVGVRVVREIGTLAASGGAGLPPHTRLVDGGTLGLDLLPMIDDARALLLVDAVDLRLAPGSIAAIHGAAIHGVLAGHVSPHQVGIGDLIAASRLMGTLPDEVTLVGIQPGEIAIGLDLTDAVEAAVPEAVRRALDELHRLAEASPLAVSSALGGHDDGAVVAPVRG